MTTPANAATELRSAHCEGRHHPENVDTAYTEALLELDTKLHEYVHDLPDRLDQACNDDCGRCGWHPIPLEIMLLKTQPARALYAKYRDLKKDVECQSGVAPLRELVAEYGLRFTLVIHPNRVSIICNFLETSGELVIQYA